MLGFHGDTVFWRFDHAETGRKAAREYAANVFNWCAARRDYPYADHPQPAIPWPLHWCAAAETFQNVLREFNRSNVGHEIVANFGC